MVERRKANEYAGRQANTYFWRTYDQKELDCIEERAGRLFGYELKRNTSGPRWTRRCACRQRAPAVSGIGPYTEKAIRAYLAQQADG
jgi:hypothetical protein